MKIWLDDVRPSPDPSWLCVKSVWGAVGAIKAQVRKGEAIEMISLDHDLGEYEAQGGNGLKLLIWMIENEFFCPVQLHTMNAVGRENMARVIRRYFPHEYRCV